MNIKHVKLSGGSLNTARHDMERIKTARESIKKYNEAQADGASRRHSLLSGAREDIDWANHRPNY